MACLRGGAPFIGGSSGGGSFIWALITLCLLGLVCESMMYCFIVYIVFYCDEVNRVYGLYRLYCVYFLVFSVMSVWTAL